MRRQFVPYAKRPRCFWDVETTGTIPGFHEITELGFDHEVKGEYSIRVQPMHMDRAEPEALRVGHYNEADWAGAPTIVEAWPRICDWLEDTIIIGHDVGRFDLNMLAGEARMKGLDDERISRAYICTRVLAFQNLIKKGLKRTKLESVCDFYGISNEGAHHALEDVRRCKQVYNRLTNGQQEMF
jgi:DNA polymerase III epsilon subunit-like protein